MASLLATAAVGRAQVSGHELQLADAGPRFLAAPSLNDPAAPVRDVRDAAVFRRRIAVDFHRTPLGVVLADIAQQAGLHLTVSPAVVAVTSPVSFSAPGITVGAALTAVLYDAGVDVQLSSDGIAIAVVPRMANAAMVGSRRRQSAGRIAGRVTDAVTGQAMLNATVVVDNGGYRATTKNDGWFTIAGVPVGAHTVTVRLLGHAPLSKPVEVRPDSATRLDFALAEAAAALEQVVTTAVGDQRRAELGNSIATLNADSLTKTAPITSLTDVLSGRAPGVEVLGSSGLAGTPVRIRIRGLSSLQLSNDPIVYVDGIRINSAPGYVNPAVPVQYGGYQTASRLNDLNPDEIASVEVLKGPSAATEYGTDAANGVIVIKTKQGQPGTARWDANTQQGVTNVPHNKLPVPWYSWGHTTDASHAPVECPLTNGYGAPSVGMQTCAVDSVTTYQPLDHAATSVLTTGHTQQYNLQVAGGAQQLRYFVAGSVASQTGVLHLDPVDAQALADSGHPIPSYARTPNVTNGTTLRGRFTAPLSGTADLAVSTGYISNYQRGAESDAIAVSQGYGYRDPVYNGYYPYSPTLPREEFLNTASQGTSRFTGGLTGTWRPLSWLATHSTVAIDAGTENDVALRSASNPESPSGFGKFTFYGVTNYPSYRGSVHQTTDVYTLDLGAAATALVSRAVTSKTSVGVQYNDSRQVGTSLQAYGLAANNSVNGAAAAVPGEIGSYAKTFGSYVEEMVGFQERLFLTGAVRVDAGSGFGTDAHSAVYPKASASWILWDSPRQSVRLRAAYGASGVQPNAGSTLTLFAPGIALVHGVQVSTDTLGALGNPRLKPERQTEFEGGVDASVLARRMDLELTYYSKVSHDALVNVTLPASGGARTEQENIGSVRNYGFEGSATLHALQTRPIDWDLTVGGSVNTNRLVSLAPGIAPVEGSAFYYTVQYRDVPGYPIYGIWAPRLHFQDLNHNGIIDPNEVSTDSTMSYIGPGLPTRQLTLSTSIGLVDGRIRIGAQFDHRGGYRIENFSAENNVDGTLRAPTLNDPRTPLWRQARAVSGQLIYTPVNSGYMEDGTFTRWRELSVRYLLPNGLVRAARARSASVTLSGRNLALWSHYTGPDPEVTTVGYGGSLPIDASFDNYSFPQVRTWVMRVDLGL